MEDRTLLSALLVLNTKDVGPGSLRQAILDASAVAGAATIDFAIPGQGVRTIRTASPLPAITGSVLIDGTSQPGYAGAPLVEINGSLAGAGNGLTITGSGSTVRGLAIDGFTSGAAILIDGPQASQNNVYGNQLGTSDFDLLASGNLHGVEVLNGAHDNEIGANSPGGSNAIGGNTATGVLLNGASIDASQGFGVSAGDLTLNGAARIQGNRLELTDGTDSERASVFTTIPVDVSEFQTQFSFQLANPVAGGFTFTIEGQGPTAIGTYQGSEGIGQSVTVSFDLGSNTGLFINGAAPFGFGRISLAGSGVDLHSGDLFRGDVGYDGHGLSVTITDTVTGASATRVYSVDIPATVGGPVAYVGFTAESPLGSGPSTTASGVTSWTFTDQAGVVGNRVVGNAITGNGGPGVAVIGVFSTGNTIGANTIAGNAGLAIDEANETASQLPQSPAIIVTAEGRLKGWLREGVADAVYHVDLFASAGYAVDGAGEAQDYLGSLDVTTDSQGQAAFDVPFTPSVDEPIVTATATDPAGNTSELSGLRTGAIQAPAGGFRISPGQSLAFSAGAGATLALLDPGAGALDSTWSVTLTVPVGALSFNQSSATGAASFQVQGTLSLINAVLAHLVFTPPAGFHGTTALNVAAESVGAKSIQSTIDITDGTFVVSSVADSGPGSLRQAILDSNATKGSNVIAFALPGGGPWTIVLAAPLPQATTPTLIDGSTQPGFSGSPLVALAGQWAGATGGLNVLGSSLSVRGVAVDAYAFGTDGLPATVMIESATLATSAAEITNHQDRYTIDTTAVGRLLVQVQVHGLATRLALIDSHGNVLVESDGAGPGNLGPVIDQHVPAGTYVLMVEIDGGDGTYELTAAFTPTSSAFEAGQYLTPSPLYPTNSPISLLVGDFNGDGIPDVVMFDGIHLGIGDGTFRSPLSGLGLPTADYYGPMVEGDFNGDGKLDIAVADYSNNTVLIVMGNGDGTFQTGTIYVAARLGLSSQAELVTGDFNSDGKLDLALDAGFQSTVYILLVGSSRVDLQACKLEYSIVSPK